MNKISYIVVKQEHMQDITIWLDALGTSMPLDVNISHHVAIALEVKKTVVAQVPRYKGIVDCGQRIIKEQGFRRFWDGNFTNCIRYFPTQAFNLAFKDTFKKMFPKYNSKIEFAAFCGFNFVFDGLAAAGSMCIVRIVDYF